MIYKSATASSLRTAALILLPMSLHSDRPYPARSLVKSSDYVLHGHPFTVKDSVEMARFGRGDVGPYFSPDKKMFVVVTTRGIIKSNAIESTVWLFRCQQISNYMWDDSKAEPPVPKAIARIAVIPEALHYDSYEPAISHVRWLQDSKTIVFVRQGRHGQRQLFLVSVASGALRALSPSGLDISQYSIVGKAIVYTATSLNDAPIRGTAINEAAFDVTGMPLRSVLFADLLSSQDLKCKRLWLIEGGKNVAVGAQRGIDQLCLLNGYPNVLSVSPDSQLVALLSPIKEVPKTWAEYVPKAPHLKIKPGMPQSAVTTNPLNPQQYKIVRLHGGKTIFSLAAPQGWALGFGDSNGAVWFPDGKKLLLLNTYLPLLDASQAEQSKRIGPCAAVFVDLVSSESNCVAFSGDHGKDEVLSGASFGPTSRDVVLQFWNGAIKQISDQRYHYEGGKWQRLDPLAYRSDAGSAYDNKRVTVRHLLDLEVEVKQNLNTPPALWATSKQTGNSKLIWNPNPQLANFDLGEAAVLHWIDSTGYKWTGGLVKPPNYVPGQRYPLVIQTHGFEENEFMTDGEYTTAFAARPLAAEGIVVLQVRPRADHNVTLDEAPDQILGFESAIKELDTAGLIDPTKVGIIGFSRTCYYVESALIKYPKLFAAATIADGVDESYIQEMLSSVGESTNEADEIYDAKPFGRGLRKWMDLAPGFHLNEVQTPLRIEAIGPGSVLAEWEIYASLWRQSKPVDFIYFPKGQHILQRPLDRLASQQGNVDWFRFWLKGETDSAPLKAAQYAIWSQIRERLLAQNEHP